MNEQETIKIEDINNGTAQKVNITEQIYTLIEEETLKGNAFRGSILINMYPEKIPQSIYSVLTYLENKGRITKKKIGYNNYYIANL